MHQTIHGLIQHGLMRRTLCAGVLAAAIGFVMIAAGCNTIEGVGRDVSAAGQTVADWASRDESR